MTLVTKGRVLEIAGARVGFDIPAVDWDHLRTAFDYLPVAELPRNEHEEHSANVWYRTSAGRGRMRFQRDDPLRSSGPVTVGSKIDELVDDLHLSIALHSEQLVFIHAGVVAWHGACILIPGRSRTGKSTLVEALVRHGAAYCSDEYACVRPDGLVAPYPRRIHLRTPRGRRTVDASTIGSICTDAISPELVVFTSYSSTAEFVPLPVTPAFAALKLFDNTVVAQVRPDRATKAAAHIARHARAVQTERPDADSVAIQILELAEQARVSS